MDVKDIVANFRLFVDTCSFMHEKAPDFFYKHLVHILIDQGKMLIIPDKVKEELKYLQKSPKPETRNAARRGAEIIKQFQKDKLIDIRGEKNDPFTDNVFHYVFSKFRTKYDLALITQDKALALEILALNDSLAIKTSKRIIVFWIGRGGNLMMWRNNKNYNPGRKQQTKHAQKFRLCSKPRQEENRIIKVDNIPGEDEYIKAGTFGELRLRRLLGEGGEGKIYLTDSGHACKIYFKDRLTERRYKKLVLMTDRKIEVRGVCWPLALAHNSNGDFVGYLMPAGEGKPMQKCMFVKPLLEKYFPRWSRYNLVQLSISLLEKIIELHKFNIFIGDVNPLNFLIKSDHELYFVDVDSYQIEDFPCPVGMANYTAPEIQGKDFTKFLRTTEHEYFAIATLLFMVLLPGKPPYSHQGGGNPIKNIKKGQFSYPLGEKSSEKTPAGPWRFIWSHLPYKTKEAFYNCFVKQERLNPHQWLDLMKGYKFALEQGHLDPEGESERLFPTRFKKVNTFAKEMYGAEDNCLENFECDNCGVTIQLNSEKANKIRNLPKILCRECYQVQELENTTGDMIVCSDCGDKFLFSISEQKFFEKKNFDPPKRCKDCREMRKESRSLFTSERYISYSNSRMKQQTNDSLWESIKDIFFSIFD